ncbi:MAG TPA: molecular chaperone TorD family protein [Symbiobacteriaceae bacterium]|nr:molecular chaperone TorD family protein [Symbiobacteriaceae bacterium]
MTMPQAVSTALSRSRLYAALSRGFLYPAAGLVQEMSAYGQTLREALGLVPDAAHLADEVTFADETEGLEEQYQALFAGQTPPCPPYETEYTATSVWMQTQQMADVAGFYRAFGVDAGVTGERVDYVATELEFMYMLCVKEAIAEHEGNSDGAAVCRSGQAAFLRDHLAAWLPRFTAKMNTLGAGGYYPALARLVERVASMESRQFQREGA